MTEQPILRRIGAFHVASIGVFVLLFAISGRPLSGILLGGGLAGLAFATFWALARSVVESQRKGLALGLALLKIAAYGVIGAVLMSGRWAIDLEGFALGVSVFVVVTIAVALSTPTLQRTEA